MTWLDTLASVVRYRTSDIPIQDQLITLRRQREVSQPWRTPTIQAALGVPAIFRAVTLISNTTGSLAMEAYRDGLRLPQEKAPRLIVRPNPLTTPREFYRDTAYAMASRGEAWWWIAKRNDDGTPASLFSVPPHELIVSANDQNRLRPIIMWGNTQIRNEDMVQVVLTREPGDLRGAGPLQMCGAAVSVSVEAQEFAANFFSSGGWPSAVIKSAIDLDEKEAQELKDQWTGTPNNQPKVIDPGIESVEPFGTNPSNWQLTEQRTQQNGEAARMFGIPGTLLEYNASGSSLTYQNVTEVYTQFVRTCLAPNYLEPIEQAMSDLLNGRTVSRFNVDGLLRADIKTRYEVHQIAVGSGVYDSDYARQLEGIEPGSAENAPVPFAPPAAVPTALPVARADVEDVRCSSCNKYWGKADAYSFVCPRCKTLNERSANVRALSALDAVDGLKLAINELRDPPQVTVMPASLPNIEVNVEPTPVTIQTDSFVEAIRDLKEFMAQPKRRSIIRDEQGRIVGVEA